MDQENIDMNQMSSFKLLEDDGADAVVEDYDLKADVGSKRRKLRRLAVQDDDEQQASSKATNPANSTTDPTRKVRVSLIRHHLGVLEEADQGRLCQAHLRRKEQGQWSGRLRGGGDLGQTEQESCKGEEDQERLR